MAEPRKRSSAWPLLAVLAILSYPSSYAALRASRVLVHHAQWSSMEGLDGHTSHWVGAPDTAAGQAAFRLFRPMMLLEAQLRAWPAERPVP